MILPLFRIGAVLVFSSVMSAAAEPTKPTDKEAVESRAKEARTVPSPKKNDVRIDQGTTVNKDAAKTEATAPLNPAAEKAPVKKALPPTPEEAAEAERARAADQASSLARGEGERYARRLKAYEAARAASARPSNEVGSKPTSIAEMVMADGRVVVVAGTDRKVFSNKAEADAYVAEVRKADFEKPIVLTPSK